MFIKIDSCARFSLISLLSLILPTFCSGKNQTNHPDLSTIKENLSIDSHVTEIYFTNETFQNSSISSNENQTLQTTLENHNISIILQIPLRNSTDIDHELNNSNITKYHKTQKTNLISANNDTSTTEENVDFYYKQYPETYFNHSNVLTFNISIHSPNKSEKFQSSDAEISPNSIVNTSHNHDSDVQSFNTSYNKGNITGVGIKATVSVSFHLMENENATGALHRMENNRSFTEQNQNSYNVSSYFDREEDNSSNKIENATDTNVTNATNANTGDDQKEIESITGNENQTEPFIVTTVVDTTTISSNSTVTVTDSEVPNSTFETFTTAEQNATTLINDITALTSYMPKENITETMSNITETAQSTKEALQNVTSIPPEIIETSTLIETSTTSLQETTVTEETTTELPLTKMLGVVKIIKGIDWKEEFSEHQSVDYKETAKNIRNLLEEVYSRSSLSKFLQEIEIESINKGSIVIDYYLILKTEPLDVDSLVHQFNSLLKENDYLLGDFTIDPNGTEFEVVLEEVKKPTSAPNIEPPVPQWVIAVVVISAASFIFILLFSAVTIYERHYTRRVYNTKLQDDEEIFEKNVTLNGRSNQMAYENLAADLVYDIDKDELEDSSQYWKTIR